MKLKQAIKARDHLQGYIDDVMGDFMKNLHADGYFPNYTLHGIELLSDDRLNIDLQYYYSGDTDYQTFIIPIDTVTNPTEDKISEAYSIFLHQKQLQEEAERARRLKAQEREERNTYERLKRKYG